VFSDDGARIANSMTSLITALGTGSRL